MNTPWIKVTRMPGHKIPTFKHPISGQVITSLKGTLNVRWPDGKIGPAEVKASQVTVLGTEESGIYVYLEVPFNGMTIIYNLDEVELLAEELTKPVAKRGKAA